MLKFPAALKLACAALLGAAAGMPAAHAQGVTVYGIVDLALESGRFNKGVTMLRLNGGAASPSRLGFRGSEQIGNDFKANYGMEIGVAPDTGGGGMGSVLFSRGAYVGLENGAVRVDVGRMFVPIFWIYLNSDPSAVPAATGGSMATLQHAAQLGRTGTAGFFDNGIRLRTKPVNGVEAELFYSNGNELGGARARDGRDIGLNVMSKGERWWLGYGYNSYITRGATDLFDLDSRAHMAGVTYDAGWIKVGGNYMDMTKLSGTGRDGKSWTLTARLPAGPGSVNLGTGRLTEDGGRAAQAMHLGYVLPMSKRTMVYSYYSRINNNAVSTRGFALMNSAQAIVAPGFDPSVVLTGLRHDF